MCGWDIRWINSQYICVRTLFNCNKINRYDIYSCTCARFIWKKWGCVQSIKETSADIFHKPNPTHAWLSFCFYIFSFLHAFLFNIYIYRYIYYIHKMWRGTPSTLENIIYLLIFPTQKTQNSLRRKMVQEGKAGVFLHPLLNHFFPTLLLYFSQTWPYADKHVISCS